VVTDKTVVPIAGPPAMSFRLFLLCSFVLLGRPQDILPFLQPLRPALVLTVLAMVAVVVGARRHEFSDALSTSESKRYLLFFFIMIVGIPFAYHRRIAFEGVLEGYIVNILFFVLVVFHITSLQRLKSLVWTICLCTLMYSVFGGLLQTAGVGGGRLQLLGQTFDPNDTAYVLVSLFPLCVFFFRFDEGLLKRVVAVAALVSSMAVILQTGSRGGILGFGAVLSLLLLSKAGSIGRGCKWLLVGILACTVLLFRDAIDVERYLTLTEISSDYNVSSKEGRLELWQAAIALSLANPLTGVGVHCFPWAHFLARAAHGVTNLQYHTVHNSYLQVAAEMGLVALGVFVLINLKSVLTFLRTSRPGMQAQSREAREIGVLGGLMLLGFTGHLVSAFFLSQGYSIFFTLYFALAATIGRRGVASSSASVALHGANASVVPEMRNSRHAR